MQAEVAEMRREVEKADQKAKVRFFCISIRDIYYAIYFGKGWPLLGKKIKIKSLKEKRKKGKKKRKKIH